ncbi:MAG: SAP domain-containing protein, partial [Candidatus Thermoplasmatota archaeon]|nr:SAP domain-containing protein [Candidatus Thermoplasmatota archaeon]
MDRDELESMTVAQLKILLEENSLSKSGKKSDLVERLLENSFLDREEDFLILEEEDHFDDEIKIPETSSSIPSNGKIDVMEATILEAVLVEDDKSPETPSLKVREPSPKKSEPMIEIKIHAGKPRRAVVLGMILLGAIVAGGGYWWTWVQDQQSFTTEPSRYGDTMSFTMTDGQISATGDEMVELLRENTGDALEKACGDLEVAMSGTGSMSFRNAPSSEIANVNDRIYSGAAESTDGYGRIHLTAERGLSYDLNVDLSGRTWTTDGSKCSNSLQWEMNSNSVKIESISWEELTEETTIKSVSSLDFRTPDNDQTRIDAVSFGGTG